MKRVLAVAVFLALGSAGLFAQSTNGSVGGLIQDASTALIPGVTVTLANTQTGVVVTTLSNEAGAYNFASVPQGTYKMTAEIPGFKMSVVNNVPVGLGAQVRQNFSLEVGAASQRVEVTASSEDAIKESSASIGDVLAEYKIRDLPMVGNNVLDLLELLPGLRPSPLGSASDTVGGLGLNTVNVTRDGLSINNARYDPQTYGINVFSPTVINPDLVSEIRLILSPVDAELGRGNSQVQISTRSGTNRYTGSAVWSIQNTGLNANTWGANNDIVGGVWTPTPIPWRNTNQITVSYGGPVIKNKTFFFALYDQQISNTRPLVNNTVATEAARNGVFRFYSGWNPGNALTAIPVFPASATMASYPSVDFSGNPQRPLFNPNGSAYTGGLYCFGVFGPTLLDGSPITAGPAAANDKYCSDAQGPGTWVTNGASAWDSLRTTPDSTGYIQKILGLMPQANYFASGDGLNYATNRYIQGRKGQGGANAIVGTNAYTERKQINLKIDENLNAKHRISGSWSFQMEDSVDNVATWTTGFSGTTVRRPHVLTVNGSSTLSATLVNEARFGMNYTKTDSLPAWLNSNAGVAEGARDLLLQGRANPTNGNVYPVIFAPGAGNFAATGHLDTTPTQIGNVSPLYNFADTLSWTRGKHALKFGFEMRLPRSNGYNLQPYPTATGGASTGFTAPFGTLANFAEALPGFLATARGNASNLLYLLSGSVASASTSYWIENAEDMKNGAWQDTTTKGGRYREQVSMEWSAFWKDDFKLTRNLTLNLGVRYDYYSSPYLRSGLTSTAAQQGVGLYGAGRVTGVDIFNNWLSPGDLYLSGYGSSTTTPLQCATGVAPQAEGLPVSTCDPSKMTTIEFVGPNTPNPGKSVFPNDRNNFGPAVGFSWGLPWWGAGKTTLRGGYQLTYGGASSNGISSDTLLGSAPGNTLTSSTNLSDANIASILATRSLNLTDLPTLVPARPTRPPGAVVPIYGRSIGFEAYDPEYTTPYTQNFTLSVTRSLRRNMSLDVRYTATIARQQRGSFDLNTNNVYYNPELLQALIDTRAGLDAPLFDQMLAGLNLNNGATNTCQGSTTVCYGTIGTVFNGRLQRGSAHLRRSATFAANLANGNFEAVAASLIGLAPTAAQGAQPLPNAPGTTTALTGVSQRGLRNGCDRIANGLMNTYAANNIFPRCFPENYFIANPQFTNATYDTNLGTSNYQALATQFTLRPTTGTSFQSTFTWAKTMTLPSTGFNDFRNRNADYARGRQAPFDFRLNGTFELPMGPNKLFFGNSTGLLARALEKWSTSIIYQASTGSPADPIGTGNMFYGTTRPVVVSDLYETPKGKVQWNGTNNATGTFYGSPNPYVSFRDPQCANYVGGSDGLTNLQTSCTLNALAQVVPAGTPGAFQLADTRWAVPILENPLPGEQGTLGWRPWNYWGVWTLNGSVSKRFQITESKSLQVRIDANNAFNHPQPGIPTFTIGNNLGQITTKSGSRTFQGQLRLSF